MHRPTFICLTIFFICSMAIPYLSSIVVRIVKSILLHSSLCDELWLTLQMEELKPYTEASKAQRAEKDRFDSRWSDLTFRNEQQLDEAIASINYRQAHETISPAEERKLIAELKKLEVPRLLVQISICPCQRASAFLAVTLSAMFGGST